MCVYLMLFINIQHLIYQTLSALSMSRTNAVFFNTSRSSTYVFTLCNFANVFCSLMIIFNAVSSYTFKMFNYTWLLNIVQTL